jgi:hypothetical protein
MVLPPTDDAIFGVVGFPGAKSVRGHQFGLGASRALLSLSLSLSLSLGTFLAILMGVKRYMSFFGCGRRPFTKRAERRRRRLPSTAFTRSAVQSSDSKIQKEFFLPFNLGSLSKP